MAGFYVGHGRHWDFMQQAGYSEDELTELFVQTANSRQQKLVWQTNAASLWSTENEMAIGLVIAGNAIESAFPYFRPGTPWPIQISELYEWPNGLEAQRTGNCHGALLSWFDPHFGHDKESLTADSSIQQIRMNALAYGIWRSKFATADDEARMGNMKAYIHLSDQENYEASRDEIQFMSHVEAVRSLDFHRVAIDVYTVTIALPDDFPMRLNVYTPRIVAGEVFAVGERITGVCWLTGTLER